MRSKFPVDIRPIGTRIIQGEIMNSIGNVLDITKIVYDRLVPNGDSELGANTPLFENILFLKSIVEGKLPVYETLRRGQVESFQKVFDLIVNVDLNLAPVYRFDNAEHDQPAPRQLICLSDQTLLFTAQYGQEFTFQVVTNSFEFIEKFQHILAENILKETEGSILVLSSTAAGISLVELDKLDESLVESNYTDEVIVAYKYILDQLQKEKPFGRLCIIHGQPGTGKTYLVKSLVSQLEENTVILIPPDFVADLSGPKMMEILLQARGDYEHKYLTLLIEDADNCLETRLSNNMSAISSLLNASDGIIGAALNLRIIATTNAQKFNIDEALTRPGRLMASVHIDKLPVGKAQEVYKRLTEKEISYSSPKTLADIYADANEKMNDYHRFNENLIQEEKKMGFK